MQKKYDKLHPLAFYAFEKYHHSLIYLKDKLHSKSASRVELVHLLKNYANDTRTAYIITQKLLEYEFIICDSDDIDVYEFSDSCQTIEYFHKNYADNFEDYFTELLLPVTDECLENMKNYCEIGANKFDKHHLQMINQFTFSLHQLKRNDVTPKNYSKKVNSYNSLKEKALGFGIELPTKIPYENPSAILIKIDQLLHKAELSQEQRQNFYRNYLSRKLPDQPHILIERLKKLQTKFEELPFQDRFLISKLAITSSNEMLSSEGQKFINALIKETDIETFQQFINENIDMTDGQNQIIYADAIKRVNSDVYHHQLFVKHELYKQFMNPHNITEAMKNI